MSEGLGARFFFTGEAGSASGGIDSAGDCCLLCGGMDTILHYINAIAIFFQILNKSTGFIKRILFQTIRKDMAN